MNESREKAKAIRERNSEARSEMYREQAQTVRAARLALQRVMESAEATPEQILEAARLLVEIGK